MGNFFQKTFIKTSEKNDDDYSQNPKAVCFIKYHIQIPPLYNLVGIRSQVLRSEEKVSLLHTITIEICTHLENIRKSKSLIFLILLGGEMGFRSFQWMASNQLSFLGPSGYNPNHAYLKRRLPHLWHSGISLALDANCHILMMDPRSKPGSVVHGLGYS